MHDYWSSIVEGPTNRSQEEHHREGEEAARTSPIL